MLFLLILNIIVFISFTLFFLKFKKNKENEIFSLEKKYFYQIVELRDEYRKIYNQFIWYQKFVEKNNDISENDFRNATKELLSLVYEMKCKINRK